MLFEDTLRSIGVTEAEITVLERQALWPEGVSRENLPKDTEQLLAKVAAAAALAIQRHQCHDLELQLLRSVCDKIHRHHLEIGADGESVKAQRASYGT